MDFVVVDECFAEVVVPGNVVAESAEEDLGTAAEPVEPGIAAAAVLLVRDTVPVALGIVAAVESDLDNVAALELEADRVADVAPDPDIAVTVRDLP